MSESEKTQPQLDDAQQKRAAEHVAKVRLRGGAGRPETQKERWVKYGANVLIASVVVVVLAGLIIYLAQLTRRRIDTTQSGVYSLKPQTVNIIKNLDSKVKLVSLYTPLQGATTEAGRARQAEHRRCERRGGRGTLQHASLDGDAAALLQDVGSDNLFIQYDVYHAQRMEGELAATMKKHLDKIAHIQIADNPGRNEPGTGEINYAWLFKYIDSIGYQGWIGCEYRPAHGTVAGLGWVSEVSA